MCLILIAHRAHPDYPLVVAANRDEWFRRPSAPAGFWPDAPHVLAGRDLEQGGTWLGITRGGRFAALTNYRDPGTHRDSAPSRGTLVSAFLTGADAPDDYLAHLRHDADAYNGFNLLVGDGHTLGYFSNREGVVRTLPPDVYGLSNGLLDDPWPKVVKGSSGLARALERGVDVDGLLALLHDRELAPEEALPATGVSPEWERKLSAMHIVAGDYGTRSSTVLAVHRDGRVRFVERTYAQSGEPTARVIEEFALTR